MIRSIVKTCVFSFIIILFSSCLIIFPEQSLHASVSGLHVWLEVVFPSLFPFFICAELFIRYGIAHFLGYLFEPIMRPIFKIPGIGSIALLIGMISGYPSGAKISTQLRKQNLLSRIEAERLLAFTNNASPLFIFGVIAIGFYQNEQIGFLVLIIHYVSNLMVGFFMRYYQSNAEMTTKESGRFQILHGVRKMHHVRIRNTAPIGQQLGDIIIQSAQTLCIIGGYIILFSVFTTFLELLSFQTIIAVLFQPFFALFQLPTDIIMPMVTGLLEITLGTKQFALTTNLSLITQLIGICCLLGFNGLSVHAQVASIISTTDIRYFPYLIGRVIHSLISLILAIIIIPLFIPAQIQMNTPIPTASPVLIINDHQSYFQSVPTLFSFCMIGCACFFLYKRHVANKKINA